MSEQEPIHLEKSNTTCFGGGRCVSTDVSQEENKSINTVTECEKIHQLFLNCRNLNVEKTDKCDDLFQKFKECSLK